MPQATLYAYADRSNGLMRYFNDSFQETDSSGNVLDPNEPLSKLANNAVLVGMGEVVAPQSQLRNSGVSFPQGAAAQAQAQATTAAAAVQKHFTNLATDTDDIDALIAANDGVGDWETNDVSTTERWLFPRFHGATDDADKYLSRSGIGGHDTDVETLVSWLGAPRNIVGAVLLLGEPGTGKTALIEAAVTHMGDDDEDGNPINPQPLTTVVCTPDHTKDSLFLRFVGEGKGDRLVEDDTDSERSPYTLGPIPYAAKHGHVLYLDEFMLLMDGVKPLVYPLADGRRYLPEGNVDGSALEVHPDFRLVLSSNPSVRGASLPEPVGSRCASTTLTVETSEAMLSDMGLDESLIAAWSGLKQAGLWHPQIREIRLADYWLTNGSPIQAVSAFLPEHCPESQREAVRNIVVSMLGEDIRTDGRLVVS